MITIQLVTEKGWQSAFIRFATWSDFSHVDFVLADGSLLGARMDGGVQIRPHDYGIFTRMARYQADAPDTVLDFAKAQIGLPYDKTGIINFGLHRDWRASGSYFCSELVAVAFESAGFPLLNAELPVGRITPRDLTLSPRLKLTSWRECAPLFHDA